MTRTKIIAALAVLVLVAIGWLVLGAGWRTPTGVNAGIKVPQLSPAQADGGALYRQYCAECHGENGAGAAKGPPLIHKYYEPNHHSDQAFMIAILYGARQHHWQFGAMKPVEGISQDEATRITAYVRAVQRANGIW